MDFSVSVKCFINDADFAAFNVKNLPCHGDTRDE